MTGRESGEAAGRGGGSPPSARIRALSLRLEDRATVIYDPEHADAWIQSTAAVALDSSGTGGDARELERPGGDGDE